MDLLKQLYRLINENKEKVSSDCAAKTYHRDYLKTKNKKYRKYKPESKK